MVSRAALRQFPWMFFSFGGRISAREFRLGASLVVMAFLVLASIAAYFLDPAADLYGGGARLVRRLVPRALLIPAAYSLGALCAKRSHDLGMPGTWGHLIWAAALGAFTWYVLASVFAPDLRPYSQLFVLVIVFAFRRQLLRRLLAAPGDAGPNEYGPPPP